MDIRLNRRNIAILVIMSLLFSSFTFFAADPNIAAAEHTTMTEGNLLTNGSFETVDDQGWASSWGTWAPNGDPQFSVDDAVYKDGTRSLKISADVTSRGAVNQRFHLTEEQRGKSYTLQQWMKTEDFRGSVYFRIQYYDEEDNRIDYIESDRLYGSESDWTLVEMRVFLPENTVRVAWDTFFENGTGTVWYDDTRFIETERGHIQNGGFEEVDDEGKPIHWGTSTFTGSLDFSVDDTVARSGLRSGKIHADASSRGSFNQKFHLTEEQKGKAYRFEQWIKTEDFAGSAYFRVQVYDLDGNRTDYVESNRIYGASDWTLLQMDLYLPEGTDEIIWDSFFENGTGTVWYDDIVFEEIDTVTNDLLQNGGFENLNANGMPEHWVPNTFTGSPQYSSDDTVARSGLRSGKIQAQASSRGVFLQRFNLWPDQRGKDYRIEQWIKTEDFTGVAYFRIQVYDEAGNRIDYVESNKISEAADWELAFMEVHLSEDAVRVTWEVFFENGTGTVWYDDTRFYPYIHLTEIQLNPEAALLLPGDTTQLDATLVPHDASDPEVTWKSSDESIVTVDDGLVTAHGEGIAAVTVRAVHHRVKADSIVTVGEVVDIVAPDDEQSVDQGGKVNGTIEATSAAGEALTYTKLTDPNHGVVQVMEDGQWMYYADQDHVGLDRFHVVVQNESGNFNVSKVTLNVLPVYLPPVLNVVIQPTDKNTSVDGDMIVVEKNGDTLSFQIEDQPAHGQAVIDPSNGNWTYTPDLDYVGSDMFTVRVENEHGKHAVTTVRLYAGPTADEIIDELKVNNPNHQHPRVLATADDFTRMRSLLDDEDERMVKWFAPIQSTADSLLTLPPHPYNKPDGLRLDTTSGGRISTLAFVYQITGDPAYAERAWEEMDFVASDAYPDWSPGHFLDTAGMTHGVSLGYDWLYDYLSEGQRAVVRQSIVEKGLSPAVPMYLNKTATWVYNRDNWNFVTNAGMTMGALAIADEEEELAGLILREAFKSIQYGLPQYAPDGSAIEGPAYWEYGTSYLVYFLSALETTFGHDFAFSETEGIEETPLFPMYITGPQGAFNYSDNSDARVNGRLLLWFANRFDKPEYTWYHQFVVENGVNPGMYDMIWYRPDTYGAAEPAYLDQMFERPKAVTMRSNWSDPNALFVGFKGGVNGAPHGDLDTGSFVFDAHGVRWALDVGNENYNLPGFWSYGENGTRWNYYRKRAEGHNTLLIHPPSPVWPDQDPHAVSHIVQTEFDRPEGSFAITDMTAAYSKSAASVKRGTALIDHRRQFLVQDEITLKEPSELYWFMHTRAQIEIDEDGQTAWLSQDGRQLLVQLITPADARFSVMDAEPMPSTPNPAGQTRNFGIKKLTIHLENQLDTTIAVRMIPILPGETPDLDTPAIVPMDEWVIEEGQLTQLNGLTINDEEMVGFSPNRYVYDVQVPLEQVEIPAVGAHAEDGYVVTIEQAAQLPGTARIEVTDPTGASDATVYYVVFQTPPQTEIPEGKVHYVPIAVEASTHDGNVPENTLDGDLNTRWSASGEQWIQYDLGEVKDLSAVAIAWYQGNTRQSYFYMELSEDGENWTTVYEGASSGETTDFELNEFEATSAQYVRIQGFGNSQSQWNSIAEVMIYGLADEEEPTPITAGSLLQLVTSLGEDGAFADEQAQRALSIHLTSVQVFEQQENTGKVVQHIQGFLVLLEHQKAHELISEQAYNALKSDAESLLVQRL